MKLWYFTKCVIIILHVKIQQQWSQYQWDLPRERSKICATSPTFNENNPEAYSDPSQIPKMKLFEKIVNGSS